MKIKKMTQLDKPSIHDLKGLKFQEMRDLKTVVALFGKNGSGKTRMLEYVPLFLNAVANMPLVKQSEFIEAPESNSMARMVFEIKTANTEILTTDAMDEKSYKQETSMLIANPTFDKVHSKCLQLIKALFKAKLASDYNSVIGNKFTYANHDESVALNKKILETILFLVENFTGKKITCSYDEFSFPTLYFDNRLIHTFERLSMGETELIAMAVFIAFQGNSNVIDDNPNILKDKIVVIDEPELFLHPEVQIKIIQKLKELVGDGQIWIATHSLALLSIFERDEIWLMKNGTVISPSIDTPGDAISELIGLDNIDRLENFLSSQYEWAAVKFGLESLFPPEQVPHKDNDPQQRQVIDYLGTPTKGTKLLDFGAGTGRIASELLKNSTTAAKIYYQPLEEIEEYHTQLRELSEKLRDLSVVEKNREREVLNTYEKLTENEYQGFFDVALLINVLHEIPINKWDKCLWAILKSLKEDGKILILEDQNLPKGENAHEYGYLIFDKEEFKKIFGLSSIPKSFKHENPKYADRLMCIEIKKSDISVPGIEALRQNVMEALKRKKSNCKKQLQSLKKKTNPKARDGRKYQFYSQLYFNVDSAMEEFTV